MESHVPYDIIRLISLYLKPYHLAINKKLFSIYDNIWLKGGSASSNLGFLQESFSISINYDYSI